MKRNDEEHQQIKLVNWIHRALGDDIWSKTHHSPNGGSRSKSEGNKFKLMGVRPGFPDLVTYVKRGKYTGLVVELKTEKGKMRTNQLWWFQVLRGIGFKVCVCYGWESAKDEYCNYFDYTGKID